jgi:hypothetical protein
VERVRQALRARIGKIRKQDVSEHEPLIISSATGAGVSALIQELNTRVVADRLRRKKEEEIPQSGPKAFLARIARDEKNDEPTERIEDAHHKEIILPNDPRLLKSKKDS